MGWLKNCFYNTEEMTEKDYSYAKVGFTIDYAMNMGAFSLVSGSYFAALLAYIGVSEAMSTFIMSFGLLGGFLQILVPLLTKNMKFAKPYVIVCKFLDRLPMALMFFVPLIFGKGTAAVAATIVLAAIAYICTYFMSPVHSDWMMKCLEGRSGIGKFNGIKDAVYNACIIMTSLVAAKVTGTFTGEKEICSYIWLGGIAFVMWAIMMVANILIKEPYRVSREKKENESGKNKKEQNGISEGLKIVFTDKKLRPYLTYGILYYIGLYLMSSLVSVMCVQRMKISLEILSYLTMGDYILRTALSPVFGRLIDKIGVRKIVFAGIILNSFTYILHAFMNPANAVCLKIISLFISSVCGAMLGAGLFVYQMESLPKEKRASCLACLSSVLFLVGTLASWATTWFISVAKGFSVNAFGIEFSEMNLVFVIGSIILAASALPVIMSKKQEK